LKDQQYFIIIPTVYLYIISMREISSEWFILFPVIENFNLLFELRPRYNDILLNFLFRDISLRFHKIIVSARIKTFCTSTWQYFQFVFNIRTCIHIFYTNKNNNYDDIFFTISFWIFIFIFCFLFQYFVYLILPILPLS